MRATLKDVAKEAGISFTLVSKYLTNNPNARMREETKKRIDEAVKKLNYRPSSVARSLKNGTTKTIGLVISNLRNPYFSLFADYTLREAKAAGYQLLISLCDYGKEEEQKSLYSLMERQCDGILYCEQMFPEIHINRNCPLVLLEQKSDRFLYAKSDDSDSLPQAVAHLASRGHSGIFSVCSEYCDWQPILEEECRKRHLHLKSRTTIPDLNARREILHEICREAPSAILSYGWQTTVQLLRLIELEYPDYKPDIITNYHFPHPLFSNPRIIGVIWNDLPNLVRETVALLLKKVEGGTGKSLELPTRFFPAGELPPDNTEFFC